MRASRVVLVAALLAVVGLGACGNDSSGDRDRNVGINAVGASCKIPGKLVKQADITYVCARVKAARTGGATTAKATRGILYGVASVKNWRCVRLGVTRFQNGVFSVCSGDKTAKSRKWALTAPLPVTVSAVLDANQSTLSGALEREGVELPAGLVLLPGEVPSLVPGSTSTLEAAAPATTSEPQSNEGAPAEVATTVSVPSPVVSSATADDDATSSTSASVATSAPVTTSAPVVASQPSSSTASTSAPSVVPSTLALLDLSSTLTSTASDSAEATTVAFAPNGDYYVTGFFRGEFDADPGEGVTNLVSASGAESAFLVKVRANGTFEWGRAITGKYIEYGTLIAADGNDGVYLAGRFAGTIDVDPGRDRVARQSAGSRSGYLIRLDSRGEYDWDAIFGGSKGSMHVRAIGLAANGDIALAGYLTGTVDVDPGTNRALVEAAGDPDGIVVKVDKRGAYKWSYVFGTETAGSDGTWARAIAVTPRGDVYVGGHSDGVVEFAQPNGEQISRDFEGLYDGFVVKLSASGAFEWVSHIASPDSVYVRAMAVDPSGNIYVTGRGVTRLSYVDESTRRVDSSLSDADHDAYVASLDSSGKWRWSSGISEADFAEGYAIAYSASGGLLVGANFVDKESGSLDMGLYQLDLGGRVLGRRVISSLGPDLIRSIALLPNGKAIIGGVDGDKQPPADFAIDEKGCVDEDIGGCQALIARVDLSPLRPG